VKIVNDTIKLRTQGFADCINITPLLEEILKKSGVQEGLLTVALPGSTGAITTIEYESGAVEDLKKALERIAPMELEYAHNLKWGDGNGFAHVRSALMGTSLSVPAHLGKMILGTWQQVVFLDFDNKPRTRSLAVLVMGREKG
jgi:secondary thiamine-phosphate synthase enzyme